MSEENINSDGLVVGAGLSGLMAAQALQKQGFQVVVVEKCTRVGGRLATPEIGPGRADVGAQFFTVRTPEFQAWVDRWLAEGLVYHWATGWSDGTAMEPASDGHPRYAVRGGMNALARHLADDLDVRSDARLVEVGCVADRWQTRDVRGQRYVSRSLVLTPPVPESLALLDAGGEDLAAHDRAALERIEYAPCLAGLFWVDGRVGLPEPGAVQRPDAPIIWVADNRRKGISPETTVVTVHAGPDHSRELWDAPEAEVLVVLRSGLQPFLDPGAAILEARLKRWRYSLPTVVHPERCLLTEHLPPLVFAGDAFGGPRVEGAALSGLAAAQALATSHQLIPRSASGRDPPARRRPRRRG